MQEFLESTDAIFFGRKSYELFIASFSHLWNDRKHYVFSNTLQDLQTGAELITNIEAQVPELKKKGERTFGCLVAPAFSSLLNPGLVDEFILALHPILLGSGKELFQSINKRILLKLTDSLTYESGLVQNRYLLAGNSK